ncbi:replication protein P [Enterovibrio sp. 27052020O]|uniref:replication protein P n=1 Tax=Enterovibrio sp. 27052020O TaxID=3241166 RepID=UPI00388F5988
MTTKSVTALAANMQQAGRPSASVLSSVPLRSTDSFAGEVINAVFNELKSTFPAWKNFFRTAEELESAKKTYCKAIMEGGVSSMTQIQRGLTKARAQQSDFFPSAGKFVGWCVDDETWRPAYERFISRKKASDYFERLVRGECGFSVRQLPAQQAEDAFKRCWAKWKAREAAGDLPEERVMLTTHSAKSASDVRREQNGLPHPSQFPKNSAMARVAARALKLNRGNDQ